jgi:hypothetical protein
MAQCGASILIGDSSGAEKAVQQFFAARNYARVVVYCVRECLNNLGNWPVRQVGMPKERALIADAKCGLFLWDGKSRETIDNVRRLLAARKKVLIYFAPGKTFHNLATEAELDVFLEAEGPRALSRLP